LDDLRWKGPNHHRTDIQQVIASPTDHFHPVGDQLLLGQRKVDDKSNEIAVMPKLVKLLEVKGCIPRRMPSGWKRRLPKRLLSLQTVRLFDM
jgi:hypothetical protein